MIKIIVTLMGLSLIFLVNWYFLFSRRRKAPAVSEENQLQEVTIRVKGGFDPDMILVKKGIPVRLNFYRDESADCSEIVVLGEFNIRKSLPAFKTTPIEFTPQRAGEFEFGCGKGLLRGRLIVR
jgi:plastocyanin domain-containing protein